MIINETINNLNIKNGRIDATEKRTKELAPINHKLKGGKCKCPLCFNDADPLNGGERVAMPNQPNGIWFCKWHNSEYMDLYGYHEKREFIEKSFAHPTKDGVTIGFELESVGRDAKVYHRLLNYGFLPTQDGTVDIEYISPVYASYKSLSKVIGYVEAVNNDPNFNFNVTSKDCGLHTHYGFNGERLDNILYKNYESVFRPLNDYICNMSSDKQVAIFGRSVGGWAVSCEWDYPDAHKNMFNIEHLRTIEFRLFRFSNADNYLYYTKVMRAVFAHLFNNLEVLDDNGIEAKEVGRYMLEIFKRNEKSEHRDL